MNQELLDQYLVGLEFFSRILQNSPDEELLKGIVENGLFAEFANWECFRPLSIEGTPGDSCHAEKIDSSHREDGGRAFSPQAGTGQNCGMNKEQAGCPGPKTAVQWSFDSAVAIHNLALAYSATTLPELNDDFYRPLYLEIHLDHLALFSGPTPKSPPWESVWRERDKLLFGKQTDKVFASYLDWGLSVEDYGHEPEDHLGLELAFALFLLQKASASSEDNPSGEPEARSSSGQTAAEALPRFLDEHLLAWAGACLNKASECAETVFYRELTKLCWLLLGNLRKDL